MKRFFTGLAAIVLAVLIAVPVMTAPAEAATSVTVTGGDNVKGGETFTVTVTYSGGSVGRVVADMSYDNSMLTYISGGSSLGNTGYIELKNAGTGEDIVFNLKFQALKDGETSIKVETREMYDLNENYLDNPSAVKNVIIEGNASDEELVDPEMAPEDEYEPSLIGVDEKEDEVDFTMTLAIGAAVAAL
ncbi:MAG: hypothetical protein J6M22_01505, partial [Firmicutes bacterium]|nr:hypothetical protein [Bacillota bacterium]